jgi:hypothetical protein
MEQELKIERTNDTPNILFNKGNGILSIVGRSLPEDAFSFYAPILEWLSEYSKSPASETNLTVNLEYFNTASAKQVFKIISLIGMAAKQHKVIVKWHYDEGDKDMKASGERFSKLCGLPFEYLKN